MSKELTFKEVIANIKEGEVWVNNDKRVSKIYIGENGNLVLSGDKIFCIDNSTCISLKSLYKLQRKEYDFQEALKALKEGKEIESCINHYAVKKHDGDYLVRENKKEYEYVGSIDCVLFSVAEIEGGWYINE